MISVSTDINSFEFRGLSTDVKPIGSNCANGNTGEVIANGSVFFEIDTKKVWMLKLVESNVGEITYFTGTWVEL